MVSETRDVSQEAFSHQDFKSFLRALDKESDRGVVLVASCMLEQAMEKTLDAVLANGPPSAASRLKRADGPLGSFSSRIDLLTCFGALDDFEFKSLHLIRKIRNKFAHELTASFDQSSIGDQSRELARHVLAEIEQETIEKLIERGARHAFVCAAFILVDMLSLRPFLVSSMGKSIHHDFAKMNREVNTILERDGD